MGSGGGGRFASGPGSELKDIEPSGDLVVGDLGFEEWLLGSKSPALEPLRLKRPIGEGRLELLEAR